MFTAATLAPHLPYVRRFARALTGSQASGDAYASATLEAILQDPSALAEHLDTRTALFRVLLKVWSSLPHDREGEPEDSTGALGAAEPGPPWRLPYHVLMLTTRGLGTVEVDFVAHQCRPGTLLWIRPGQAVRLADTGLDAALVTFEPHLAGSGSTGHPDNGGTVRPDNRRTGHAENRGTGQPVNRGPGHPVSGGTGHPAIDGAADPAEMGPGRWQLEGEDEDAVISEFTQLAVDCDRHSPGPLTAALLHHQLAVLLLRIALLTERSPAGPESRTFARFRRRLEQGHPSSRRVEDYAEDLGCSVRTLTRASLAVTGRTAKQVVDDRVALEARRLLACTPMSVAEVGRHL